MPACPNCGDMLTSNEWKSSSCPVCGARVGWTRGPHTTDFIDGPHKITVVARDLPGWGTVRAGLGLLIVGTIVMWCCGAVVVFVDPTAGEFDGRFEEALPGAGKTTMHMIATFAFVGSIFVGLAGMVLCTAVPGVSRAKIWMLGCAGCMGLMLISIVDVIQKTNENRLATSRSIPRSLSDHGKSGSDARYEPPQSTKSISKAERFSKILGVFSQCLFLLFLWALAKFIRKKRLATSAIALFAVSASLGSVFIYGIWDLSEPSLVERLTKSIVDIGNVRFIVLILPAGIAVWFVATLIAIRVSITKLLRGEYL